MDLIAVVGTNHRYRYKYDENVYDIIQEYYLTTGSSPDVSKLSGIF